MPFPPAQHRQNASAGNIVGIYDEASDRLRLVLISASSSIDTLRPRLGELEKNTKKHTTTTTTTSSAATAGHGQGVFSSTSRDAHHHATAQGHLSFSLFFAFI